MPDAPAATRQDLEHLHLLTTFHYVVAGISALFGLFPIVHFAIGLVMLLAPGAMFHNAPDAMPFRLVGLVFVLLPGAMMAAGFALAGALIKAARGLKRHTDYRFCQVVAAVACTFFPFGTVLGVFTLIVLSRPGVRTLFGEEDLAAPVG